MFVEFSVWRADTNARHVGPARKFADHEKSRPDRAKKEDVEIRARWIGIPIVIGALGATDYTLKVRPATLSARAFVSAVRASSIDAIHAHATIDLAKRIDAREPNSELGRAYEQIRISTSIDDGFMGDWSSGCMSGKINNVPIYLVMAKVDGAWLVSDLRIDKIPKECEDDSVD
jgi:hypothetical protein